METDRYSFSELCQALGKSRVLVRNLQNTLKLHIPDAEEGYSEAYLMFMEGIIALRTFSVSLEEIGDLFRKELKILRLLHVDSMSDSPTWYLDLCTCHKDREGRLLLTGHDLGFSTAAQAIQANLDFRERPTELFKGVEMGEDIRRVMTDYIELVSRVRSKVHTQKDVLKNALAWAQRFL